MKQDKIIKSEEHENPRRWVFTNFSYKTIHSLIIVVTNYHKMTSSFKKTLGAFILFPQQLATKKTARYMNLLLFCLSDSLFIRYSVDYTTNNWKEHFCFKNGLKCTNNFCRLQMDFRHSLRFVLYFLVNSFYTYYKFWHSFMMLL